MIKNLPKETESLVLSYIGLRRAIGISGLLLPLMLGPIGWLVFGIEIQDNMSSYYHTPLRDVFVGTLCAMAIFLFCYRGNDWVENWTANFGCISALGIALCPLDANSDPLFQTSITGYLHSVAGGIFFLTLSFYSLFHFPSSKGTDVEKEPKAKQRDLIYRVSGIVILLSVLAMGGYLVLFPTNWKERCNEFNVLFWLEWVAVWAFAAAWLTKGRVIVAEIAVELIAITQEKISKYIR